MKKLHLYLFLLLAALAILAPSLAAAEAAAPAPEAVPGADLVGMLPGYLPDSWNGWVTLVVTICAALSAVWPRPKDSASPVVRLLYAVVNALGFNAGKARNADDAAAKAAKL